MMEAIDNKDSWKERIRTLKISEQMRGPIHLVYLGA